jgi:outer membrane protein OmpA-like peptidoglycan-associated protein
MRLFRVVLLLLCSTAAAAQDVGETYEAARERLLGPTVQRLETAKDQGAERRLQPDYEAAVAALRAAERCLQADPGRGADGGCDALIERARALSVRLVHGSRFVEDLRRSRHEWLEVLRSYDRLIERVATVGGLTIDPDLAGPPAGEALVGALDARFRRLGTERDSLAAIVAGLQGYVDSERAAQDSTIAGLNRELTAARHSLWEMELRAGVAEADRSAAESRIRRLEERERLVKSLGQAFTAEEGTVWLTPDGDVRIRLVGLKFASGSAWLNPNYLPLLDRAATVAGNFPAASVRVEGHTDDSGERALNLSLSAQRARVVADALAERMGVEAAAVAAEGLGPDHPAATNATPAGRAQNRRIEILIIASAEDD